MHNTPALWLRGKGVSAKGMWKRDISGYRSWGHFVHAEEEERGDASAQHILEGDITSIIAPVG